MALVRKELARVIVLDISSDYIKAGWAGEDTPRCWVPAILVREREEKGESKGGESGEGEEGGFLVGEKALTFLRERHRQGGEVKGVEIIYPVRKGRVVEWEAIVYLIRYIFVEELKVGSAPDHTVLVTDTPMSSEEYRRKLSMRMFSEFRLPALCIANRATMALFDSGKSTGIVLVTAGDISHAVPIYNGFALPHATISSNVASEVVTNMMKSCFHRMNFKEATEATWAPVIVDMMRKSCFVISLAKRRELLMDFISIRNENKSRKKEMGILLDPNALARRIDNRIKKNENAEDLKRYRTYALNNLADRVLEIAEAGNNEDYKETLRAEKKALKVEESLLYELPQNSEGKIVEVHDLLRYITPEALFAPSQLLGNRFKELGLQDLLYRSIKMCDSHLENVILSNIVIAGEITEMPGFSQRLQQELEHLFRNMFKNSKSVNVVSTLRRKDSAWRGGSMFATLPTFNKIRFTREKFQEDEKVVLKRYF